MICSQNKLKWLVTFQHCVRFFRRVDGRKSFSNLVVKTYMTVVAFALEITSFGLEPRLVREVKVRSGPKAKLVTTKWRCICGWRGVPQRHCYTPARLHVNFLHTSCLNRWSPVLNPFRDRLEIVDWHGHRSLHISVSLWRFCKPSRFFMGVCNPPFDVQALLSVADSRFPAVPAREKRQDLFCNRMGEKFTDDGLGVLK